MTVRIFPPISLTVHRRGKRLIEKGKRPRVILLGRKALAWWCRELGPVRVWSWPIPSAPPSTLEESAFTTPRFEKCATAEVQLVEGMPWLVDVLP